MDKLTLHDNLAKIRQVMDYGATIDNPESVLSKLNALQNIIGLSSECMAWAGKLYEAKILEGYSVCKLTAATERKVFATNHAGEEGMLLNYANSLNKDAHYQVESLRTMLSYLKQEMKSI